MKRYLKDVEWRFITDYWDTPLAGVVTCDNKHYLAVKSYDSCDEWNGQGEEPELIREYTLYNAPTVYWILQNVDQFLFEKVVGTHWSYPFNTAYKEKSKFLTWAFYKVWNHTFGKLTRISNVVNFFPVEGIWRLENHDDI